MLFIRKKMKCFEKEFINYVLLYQFNNELIFSYLLLFRSDIFNLQCLRKNLLIMNN